MLGWTAGGSVAGWGATGFGVATGHDQLHRGFYQAVFNSGVRTLGLATAAGKQKPLEQRAQPGPDGHLRSAGRSGSAHQPTTNHKLRSSHRSLFVSNAWSQWFDTCFALC